MLILACFAILWHGHGAPLWRVASLKPWRFQDPANAPAMRFGG